ncbi:radical SAM protein [Candidatus Microgenomates bacterium]|nr:radical SAM protein [Candidatus Microgenomates bacterium]
MKYFIKTFGCSANVADSERIEATFKARGFTKARTMKQADHIVINTCMVRESAENRVYGLVHNLAKLKIGNWKLKIILTGCMVGMVARDKTGKLLNVLRKRMPEVDEFLPIEEVGFEYEPVRGDKKKALIPISNGCNNFCTFCVVPFTRGREISRPFEDIVNEVKQLVQNGYEEILLIGQNVNSYGADLLVGADNIQVLRDLKDKTFFPVIPLPRRIGGFAGQANKYKVTYVKHLGRQRIPTLFPELLNTLAQIQGINKIDFISSNPWDFSEELIEVIAKNPKITRNIHLPVQSGDNEVLKKMNRWYTREEYLKLIKNLKSKIKNIKVSTDIIVGFCGETNEQFNNTVKLCREVGFYKAYISQYSDRSLTAAHKAFKDNVSHAEKERRWKVLDKLVNRQYYAN